MNWLMRVAAPIATLGCAVLAGTAQAGPRMSQEALQAVEWRNLHDTVHIRTHNCGESLCGAISWASEKATTDAQKSGVNQLVGTEVFRDFQTSGEGEWRGKVYVPDMKRSFSGTISFPDENTMIGRGCLVAGLLCKTSTWVRIR